MTKRWRSRALLPLALVSVACAAPDGTTEVLADWSRVTAQPARRAPDSNEREPRHVIIVIGDGMQLAHEVAASRYLYGTDDGLSFHSLPTRLYKTTWDVTVYDARAARLGAPRYLPDSFDPAIGYDPKIGGEAPYPILPDNPERRSYFLSGIYPDSASTATAMSTGIKTDSSNIAWFPGDPPNGALATTPQMLRRQHRMSIGYVTTVPFSHATPSGWFAHNPDRNAYHALGREILLQTRPNVVIGGGLAGSSYVDPADLEAALATDQWVHVERQSGVDGGTSLRAAAREAVRLEKRLLGSFGGADGNFESPVPVDAPGSPDVRRGSDENPWLADAAVAALDVLSANPRGFFLLVEQGDIDWSNHANDYWRMVGCVTDLDRGVQAILDYVDRPGDALDWSNTTLVVTADHANSYLRLERRLGRGDLPNRDPATSAYTDGDITYGTGSHTPELVSLYAKGRSARYLEAATVYEDIPKIVDDTSIFGMTLDAVEP
jgi:alkaline phosphatase